MKKLTTLTVLFILLTGSRFPDADCSTLIFFKEGTSTVMTSYNEDGKPTGSSKTVYTKVSKIPGGSSVTAQQENFDKKGKSQSKFEFTIKCEKGILHFDMKSMMPNQQGDAYKDFEMSVEGTDKEMPSSFTVGSSLKDAEVRFKFKSKEGTEIPMMNMSVKITNRKVEAKESVTTPAGTYECYRMSEDIESKSMFSVKMKSKYWFNAQVGTVKNETYKDNGKFMGRTELTEIKN